MEARCKTCQLVQRKFYCAACLRAYLRDFRSIIQRAAPELDELELARVSRNLSGSRADQVWLEASNTELREETQKARFRLAEDCAHAASRREALNEQRSQLQRARQLADRSRETTTSHLRAQIQSVLSRIQTIETSLANGRKTLIKALVQAFDLKEGSGTTPTWSPVSSFTTASYNGLVRSSARMPVNALWQSALGDGERTVSAVKKDWSIAGLVLPVAGDLRHYSPESIDAAVTYTIKFLQLLTYYLGVKLPFEITWSGPVPGAGYPSIAAGHEMDCGDTAEWASPRPLYLISGTEDIAGSSLSSSQRQHKREAFTTALCMLNYNIAYLSNTQGLDVPLDLVPEALGNLWSICCIHTQPLARAPHATISPTYPLPSLTTPQTYTLEFEKVLQAYLPTASNGTPSSSRSSKALKSSKKQKRGDDIEDEWYLLDLEYDDEC